jgi:hypothetical protein
LTCAAFPGGSLKPDNYDSLVCPSASDGHTRRKEKQSARTVWPKTLRAKRYKKRRHETREDFSGKEKYMRFAASRCWEMTTVGPAQPKEKRLPSYTVRKRFSCANSDSEYSACLSGLFRKKLSGYHIAWGKVQHSFLSEHQTKFKRLLARHADISDPIFDDSGLLRQTCYIKHDIVVTGPKPFRLPPYRYSAAK